MTVMAGYLGSTRFIPQLDSAVSEEAHALREIEAGASTLESSSSVGQVRSELLQRLFEAYTEASKPDWDGSGAHAAQPGSLLYAMQFLETLSSIGPPPSIFVDPDGEIAIEWDYGPRQVFSVHVGRDGTLNYAGLSGHTIFHGVEILRESLPEAVSLGIKRVAPLTPG